MPATNFQESQAYSQDQPIGEDIAVGYGDSSRAGQPSSHEWEIGGPKSVQVQLQRRDKGNGFKFDWNGYHVKTERTEWDRAGNVMKMRKPFRGHNFWGYRPSH